MTLTVDLGLDRVIGQDELLCQKSRSKVIQKLLPGHKHTQRTECCIWTTKVIGKNAGDSFC